MDSCKPKKFFWLFKTRDHDFFLNSWNHGQTCCAGTRIFVQAGIYDEFLKRFSAKAREIKVGDPFGKGVDQGPQVSQIQYDVSNDLLLEPYFSKLIQ